MCRQACLFDPQTTRLGTAAWNLIYFNLIRTWHFNFVDCVNLGRNTFKFRVPGIAKEDVEGHT